MRKNIKTVLLTITFFIFCNPLFSAGTGAGIIIESPSTNVEITYTGAQGSDVTEDGSIHSLNDYLTQVLEINGLVETLVDVASLAPLSFSGGIYNGVTENTNYILKFTYLNRGNTDEEIVVSADVVQETGNWGGERDVTYNLLEDSLYEFIVTLNAPEVVNKEIVTLNILSKLVTATNVVSYNAFTGAYIEYAGPAGFSGYGGTDNITHTYVFAADGFDVIFVNRVSDVVAPPTYSGDSGETVPGSKIRYYIAVKNNSNATAKDVLINDLIANNCHYYPTEGPAMEIGGVVGVQGIDWTWEGSAIDNTADDSLANAIVFKVDIGPGETVTAAYSVTID